MTEQLKNIRLIQKFNKNKIINYHLTKNCESLFLDQREDLLYAEFNYKLAGQKMSSKLIVSAGKISSLETRKGIDNKNLKMSCEDCKCKIKLIEEITLSQEIDLDEHGAED